MSREVMQQALEALENSSAFVFIDTKKGNLREAAITALRAALAEQDAEQEVPGSWRSVGSDDGMRHPEACDLVGGETDMPAEQAETVASDRERFEAAWNGCWRHLGSSLVASAKELAWSTWQAGAAPPAPARQEPLTEEQIAKAADAIDDEAAFSAGFYEGARFAERAHGIK